MAVGLRRRWARSRRTRTRRTREGSNAYATAFAAYVMQQAAGDPANPKLARALAWLRTHQNAGMRLLAGGLHEQAIRTRVDADEVHDRRRHFLRRTGAAARRKMRPLPFPLRIDWVGRYTMRLVVVTALAGA